MVTSLGRFGVSGSLERGVPERLAAGVLAADSSELVLRHFQMTIGSAPPKNTFASVVEDATAHRGLLRPSRLLSRDPKGCEREWDRRE